MFNAACTAALLEKQVKTGIKAGRLCLAFAAALGGCADVEQHDADAPIIVEQRTGIRPPASDASARQQLKQEMAALAAQHADRELRGVLRDAARARIARGG